MMRLGNRWEWYDDVKGYRLKSNLLVGTRYIDSSDPGGTGNALSSSHKASTYAAVKVQDQASVGFGSFTVSGGEFTYYRWDSASLDRGFPDLNETFADLSGSRFEQVEWKDDERMARAPGYSSGAAWPTTHWEWVPKQ